MAENNDLRHPVVLISISIIAGVFVLIGSAIIGWDHGVLESMSDSEFARGLITYLFAVVTIGTAVVLVVSLLTSDFTEINKDRIDKGKDILSLLLGVFGTIVGFYFGSEIGGQTAGEEAALRVTPALLSEPLATSNQSVTVTAAVSGGESPYLYGITIGEDGEMSAREFVSPNAWIVHELTVPVVQQNTIVPVIINVQDASGESISSITNLAVSPQ